jgi:hypothetical protein
MTFHLSPKVIHLLVEHLNHAEKVVFALNFELHFLFPSAIKGLDGFQFGQMQNKAIFYPKNKRCQKKLNERKKEKKIFLTVPICKNSI